MTGIIFIVLSIIILIVLLVISKKSRTNEQLENLNQQNNAINSNSVEQTKEYDNSKSENLNKENLNMESCIDSTEVTVDESSNDYERYDPKSYKSDEDYRRMASLVKNIYFSLVAVVFVILGVLYFLLF